MDTTINILLANKLGALIHYNKDQEEQLQCLGVLTTSSLELLIRIMFGNQFHFQKQPKTKKMANGNE
jgi:hypothetical protein